jgi:histidine phosphotransferase ChpT
MQIDLRVMELLASKICHDLVSPVSAINNGVELIEEVGGSVVDEAMKLIGNSAGNASRRLKLFRVAYGRAGSEENLAVKDVRQIAEQYLAGGKIMLHWADDQPATSSAERRGFLKTMLNLVILSEEVLAYGGVVNLRTTTEGESSGCRFEIVGRNAQLSPAFQAALDGTVAIEELTPRTIQPYITGRLAESFNLKLLYDQSQADRLDLSLLGAPELVAAA